jgi:UDP-N-acetylmuramoyl-tripeptide--D-alanyl-D-alanine ligase
MTDDASDRPTPAALSGIWKGFKWLWKGVEWRLKGLCIRAAYGLYCQCMYWLTFLHRRSLSRTVFIGITGSAGKSTTKDLVASILGRHVPGVRKSSGTANRSVDLAGLVLGTQRSDTYCVAEISILTPGYIDFSLALVRPTVGVVTNIGGDHFSAYRNFGGVAAEKSKLIRSLPDSGIAILNADDPRVLAMQSQFSGRTVTYGMGDDAMLRGEAVSASWPDRLSLTVKWKGESARVQTQLCGSHWVSVVLGALATGVALGVPLAVAAEAVASVEPFEGRMSPVQLGDGVTFIRDDWKAPLWSIAPTFEFMRQARATRKVIVMGTISDSPGDYSRRYAQIARQALAVADCVLCVGNQASACLRAKREEKDMLFAFSLRDAATFLSGYLRPGDLVLLKGSVSTDHLERLILVRTSSVECWRSACGRRYFCNACDLLQVSSGPQGTIGIGTNPGVDAVIPIVKDSSVRDRSEVVVIGLGNPEEHRSDTRHNVGSRAVEIIARRVGQDWVSEGHLAKVCRGVLDGTPICLVKPLALMNDIGPALLQIAKTLDFDVSQCILVHDDLDLPLGTVRTRMRGGAAGHRGVLSILQAFQDDKFRRVKIGIGKPESGQSVADYVLTPFPPEQLAAVDAANRVAADQVIELIRQASPSTISLARKELA